MAHEWILYIDSDAQVGAQTNNVLSAYDLRQLREDDGWMTDSLIHYAVAHYSGARGDLHNGVAWYAPSLVKSGKDGDEEAFTNSLGAALGDVDPFDQDNAALPGNANVLLFPVNTEDTHWSLLAFYKADRTFVHYDSLGQSNDGAARALLTRLHETGYLLADNAVFTRPPEVVPQVDGYNCGLYVTQFARKIMETGRKLTGPEIGQITSQSSDVLRGQILTSLQPHFPPAPIGLPPPVFGGGSSQKRLEKRRPVPKKKGAKDVVLKKAWNSSKGGRKDKIKAAVLLATNNDRPFTKCFIHTSPSATSVIQGDRSESLFVLVEEARALWEVLGESSHVPAPRQTKKGVFLSKYSTYADKGGFSLVPQFSPESSPLLDVDRTKNVIHQVTDEGYQPTFFQFQRQDMDTILAHYERSVPDHNHNHQHIARSLILGMAMANFYVVHKQPRFLPGDTRPEEMRKNAPDLPGQREAALEEMPEPAEDEVDVAAIAYGIGMHDCARVDRGKDLWEHESARNCFYYLKDLGYGNTYAAYVARMIVKNEDNDEDRKSKGTLPTKEVPVKKPVSVSKSEDKKSGKTAKNTARVDEEKPPREQDLNEQIVHDADTLEIHRVLNHRKFEEARLHFLTDKRLDKVKLDKKPAEYRAALIADAALFVELTTQIGRKAEDGEDGKPSGPGVLYFEDKLKERRTATGRFGGYFEAHESVLIEAIMQKPKSFPFFYEYYFHRCFDPKDPQIQALTPEERLVLVRARIHTIERLPRDYALATISMDKVGKKSKTAVKVDDIAKEIAQFQITANLCCDQLDEVIDTVDALKKTPAHLMQYWEVFFKTEKTRVGASTNSADRDHAELFKVQYQTPCEAKSFVRSRRPKYAAVNMAKTSAGACPKYGDAVYVFKPHLWRRISLTHNDTFSTGVFPDDLCTPEHPFTLMRHIDLMRFQEDHLKLYAAGKGQEDGMRKAAQKGASIPYVEAHIHGLVTWADDVEEIRINVNPKDREAYKDKKKVWDWAAFDNKVLQFGALWATKDRPGGIPVRFVNAESFDLFATRADAQKNINPLKSDALTGKLGSPTKMKSVSKKDAPKKDKEPKDKEPKDKEPKDKEPKDKEPKDKEPKDKDQNLEDL